MPKKSLAIVLCFCFVMSLTACSQRGGQSTVQDSQAQPASVVASEATAGPPEAASPDEDTASEPDAEPQPEEPRWNPADYPDPTLQENMKGPFYSWEHLEYRSFEQPDEYRTVEVIPTGFEDEEQRLMMSIRLPSVYSFGEYNRIMYDGGFQELLPLGDIVFCDIYDNSKEFLENALYISKQRSVDFVLGGASYDMIPQNSNTPGSYIANDKFIRCVFASNMGNHEIVYIVKAMTGAYVAIKFEVSAQADVNDLALYDAIAESVRVSD